jgi:TRAP-type C4-dicarboxylate transport system permease small subunit
MPLRLLPLAVGPAILLPLAAYAFRHRRVRGAIWYCVLLLAIALWSAAYAWELAAPDFADKLLALRIKYVGVIALPVAWIGFVLDFVASERAVVRRANQSGSVSSPD